MCTTPTKVFQISCLMSWGIFLSLRVRRYGRLLIGVLGRGNIIGTCRNGRMGCCKFRSCGDRRRRGQRWGGSGSGGGCSRQMSLGWCFLQFVRISMGADHTVRLAYRIARLGYDGAFCAIHIGIWYVHTALCSHTLTRPIKEHLISQLSPPLYNFRRLTRKRDASARWLAASSWICRPWDLQVEYVIKADIIRCVAADIAHFAALKSSKCHLWRVSILRYNAVSLHYEVPIKNHALP